ncbi:MAG: hypothetical protein LIO42_02495, partial [Oscillospiraceae bacterium]|nr:hypothetical protein [Oscillospiraceae bacterium]
MSDTPKKKNSWLVWAAAIVALVCGFWPLALILAAFQLFRSSRAGGQASRHPYDIQRQQARQAAAGE